MPGTLIVLEGPDGAGTTTHGKLLAERLRASGKQVVLTAEPTKGKYGKQIRAALTGASPLSHAEIQKLFAEDRREHVERLIKPALARGAIVICDRYVPSSLVYGAASGVPAELLLTWNAAFPSPDLTLVLLPHIAVCRERLGRRQERDVFEQEEFQRRVYDGYTRYAREHPEVKIIDTSGGKEESAEKVWGVVLPCLHARPHP